MSIVAHKTEDVRDLSPGDLVRVRSATEIFRTLDGRRGQFRRLAVHAGDGAVLWGRCASIGALIRRATAPYRPASAPDRKGA
jgi:hypothetical protein